MVDVGDHWERSNSQAGVHILSCLQCDYFAEVRHHFDRGVFGGSLIVNETLTDTLDLEAHEQFCCNLP